MHTEWHMHHQQPDLPATLCLDCWIGGIVQWLQQSLTGIDEVFLSVTCCCCTQAEPVADVSRTAWCSTGLWRCGSAG